VAEAILVTIVVLARIKAVVWVVYFDIGFDSPVLMGLQTWRRSGFPEWNNMVID
jgi:hypothetical protein